LLAWLAACWPWHGGAVAVCGFQHGGCVAVRSKGRPRVPPNEGVGVVARDFPSPNETHMRAADTRRNRQ